MGDRDLRELERRWAETGADEDYAALLKGQVRAGVRTAEQVELGAFLGSEGARLSLDTLVAGPPVRQHAYGSTGGVIVGLREDFGSLVSQVSVAYLQELWEVVEGVLEGEGISSHAFNYGGSGGPIDPSPGLISNPIEGFGWVENGRLQLNAAQVRELNQELVRASSGRLFAGLTWQRAYRLWQPLSHHAGLVTLLEWCLDDETDWPRELLPGGAGLPNASPVGQFLLGLARSEAWWRDPMSPFEQGARPLLPLLREWALV